MLIRIGFLGGILSLTVLSCTSASRGEEKAAESDLSKDQAPATGEASAAGEPAQAEGAAIEIPLSEIWAHMMPGTRKISELEKDIPNEESERRLMGKIGAVLGDRYKQAVNPAFAVEGIGIEALRNANSVLVLDKPIEPLREGRDVSIVFFTHYSGYYVHLVRIEVAKQTIRVMYRLVPHHTHDLTLHFALIPIGPFPKGQYQVEVAAEKMAQDFLDQGFKEVDEERKSMIVSPSFRFEVR